MKGKQKWLSPRLAAMLAAATVAFAGVCRAQAQCLSTSDVVVLNRRIVPAAGDVDLLELLRRHVSPHRLGIHAMSPEHQPAVVVDGTVLNRGIQSLADVRAQHVESVSVLRPYEAVHRFGGLGSGGAIVVTTRRGPPSSHVASTATQACRRPSIHP